MEQNIKNEQTIKYVEVSMGTEGFKFPEFLKMECRDMLEGKISADEIVQKHLINYKKK